VADGIRVDVLLKALDAVWWAKVKAAASWQGMTVKDAVVEQLDGYLDAIEREQAEEARIPGHRSNWRAGVTSEPKVTSRKVTSAPQVTSAPLVAARALPVPAPCGKCRHAQAAHRGGAWCSSSGCSCPMWRPVKGEA
jgi:hypothetical protein